MHDLDHERERNDVPIPTSVNNITQTLFFVLQRINVCFSNEKQHYEGEIFSSSNKRLAIMLLTRL